MFENTTLLEIFGSVLAVILSVFMAWLGKKIKADDSTREALEALNVGVNSTYQSYVRGIKKGHEDGKLSDDESKMARRKAMDYAKKVATGAGLKVLLSWGTPKVESMIQDLVNKKKKRG